MLIYNGMDKKIVIYSHNEILHSTRKKQTVITYNNMYGSNSLRLSKKQKFMQYDSTYIELKIWEKLNYSIRYTYNNGKYIKNNKEVITGKVRLMITSTERVLYVTLQVILTVKIVFKNSLTSDHMVSKQ